MINQPVAGVLNFSCMSNNLVNTPQQIYPQNAIFQTYQPQPTAFYINTNQIQPIVQNQNINNTAQIKKSENKKINDISKTLKKRELEKKISNHQHQNQVSDTNNRSLERQGISNLSEARKLNRKDRLIQKSKEVNKDHIKSKEITQEINKSEPGWKADRYSMPKESLPVITQELLAANLGQSKEEAIHKEQQSIVKDLDLLRNKRKGAQKINKEENVKNWKNEREKILKETIQRIEDLQNTSNMNIRALSKKQTSKSRSKIQKQKNSKINIDHQRKMHFTEEDSLPDIENLLDKLQNDINKNEQNSIYNK